MAAEKKQNVTTFGMRDKLGYMFGDIGNDFTFILSSSFLMKFYTDVMGVDGFLAKPVPKDILIQKVLEVYRVKQSKENRKTVLMIDDDMSYLKQVNTMLQDNYNVVIINSAKLALTYLTKHIPDIIIMDYQMPLYNGASLMNIIQKNTRCTG